MLRRLTYAALAMSMWLTGMSVGWAQPAGGRLESAGPGAYSHGQERCAMPGADGSYLTQCQFDPYDHLDTARIRGKQSVSWLTPWRGPATRPSRPASFGHDRTGYPEMDSGIQQVQFMTGAPGADGMAPPMGPGAPAPGVPAPPGAYPIAPGSPYDPYAIGPDGENPHYYNPNTSLSVEKRLFINYGAGNGHGRATRFGYGDYHSGQVGIEVLPWVIADSEHYFSRWGGTIMFDYMNYEGNRAGQLLSLRSLTVASPFDGETFSCVFGPTYRTDFEFFGVKMSPNAMVGASLGWTRINAQDPPGNPPVRQIQTFKFTGFDIGLYTRLLVDFPITSKLNFSIGTEFQFVPTDVMVRSDGDARKHLGLVLGFSSEF